MASTLITPALMVEEPALKGAHRSRLSVHFNTRRVRRWFLVQMVSVPVTAPEDSQSSIANYRPQDRQRQTLGAIVDRYTLASALRPWM